jgi:hypothetical protein
MSRLSIPTDRTAPPLKAVRIVDDERPGAHLVTRRSGPERPGSDSSKPKRALPAGLTPRLLSAEAAAEYCGISPGLFKQTIGKAVPPVEVNTRLVWDIRALDRWIDRQGESGDANQRQPSIEERLNGI